MSAEALVRWGMRIRSLEWELMLTRSVPSSPCASVALLWSSFAAADWGVKTLFLRPHHHRLADGSGLYASWSHKCLLPSQQPWAKTRFMFGVFMDLPFSPCSSPLLSEPNSLRKYWIEESVAPEASISTFERRRHLPDPESWFGADQHDNFNVNPPAPYFCIVLAVWHGYFFFRFLMSFKLNWKKCRKHIKGRKNLSNAFIWKKS